MLEPGPKYCHFPKHPEAGYDLQYFNGLLSEREVVKSERGRTRLVWEKIKGHERNEALDCRNYAQAALRVLDPDMDAVEARLRGLTPEQKPQPRQTRPRVKKNNAVNEW